MAHHKRRKPKSSRAGCLYCKPHKHQGAKDCFDSKTVQEQRELQDEIPPGPRKSRRKNRRWWCGGKEGRPHEPAWIDRGRWWHSRSGPPRYHSEWTLCCQKCGKHLGLVSRWGKRKVIVYYKFPGWERFQDGPSEVS